MIVSRWQASMPPTVENLKLIYRLEGLTPKEETFPASKSVNEHRHPFDEIRTVVSGELMVNVSGNKLLLRAGDRIVIPANTRHSYEVQSDDTDCVSFFSERIY